MRRALHIAVIFLMISLAIPAGVPGLYILRVQYFEADPANGYFADFYLYLSPKAERMARDKQVVSILVQPNNSGISSDDPQVHRRDAWWTGFERRRIDLQLIAMIEHARAELAKAGIQTDERVLIQGFSASGMFANRFTILHPERVKAAAIGSPGGWPIAPVASFAGEQLPYPAGISDIELLTDNPFDAISYNTIPQLIYMGSADHNDSLDYADGWDEKDSRLVDRLFGPDPLSRWEKAESLYREEGANVEFLLIDGVGHARKELQTYSTEFFKKVLNGE